MKKILSTTALILATLCSPALAQTNQMTDQQWLEIRSFLERTPDVLAQVKQLSDQALLPNQMELDSAFIAQNADALFNDPMAPVLGNPEGDVLMVKFSDFKCGHCRNASPELEALLAANPRVKLVIREFPILGAESTIAAKYALAVKAIGGDAAYDVVKKAIFTEAEPLTGFYLDKLSERAGLDPKAVIERMEASDISDHITATRALAAGLKINGTPALILKDVVVRGSIPLDAMQQGIAELYPN